MDYHLDGIIRQCWWTHIDVLKHFETFCNHCLSILMYELNIESKAEMIDFDALVSGFLTHKIENDPIYNPHSEYNPISVVDAMDGRLICRLLNVDEELLSSPEKLGISKETCEMLDGLFMLIKSELGQEKNKKIKLFPVLQSKETLALEIPASEKPRIKEDHAFVNNENELVQSLVPDLERDLARNGLLAETKRISGHKGRIMFYKEHNWLRGITVPDDIPIPKKIESMETWEHRRHNKSAQQFITFMTKYAASLSPGKIVLRDVIVGASKNKESKDGNESKSNEKESQQHHQQQQHPQHKHSHKGGGGRKGKKQQKKGGIVDVRAAAEEEVKRKAREEKISQITNLINMLAGSIDDVEVRIARLDEKLSNMSDPHSALPGLEQLHKWCTESALKSIPEKDIYPSVRLWQVTFDIFRRFVKPLDAKSASLRLKMAAEEGKNSVEEDILPDPKFIIGLQKSLHIFGFREPAAQLAQLYLERCKQSLDPKHLEVKASDVVVPFKSEDVRVSVGSSYERFQLQHCGPYMIRYVLHFFFSYFAQG